MLSIERTNGTRRVGWLSLIGLLLVPLVVAGGFLAATWSSDTRLDRVQAAVVNLDQPVRIDKQLVPLGRQLAGGLVNGAGSGDTQTEQNFDWVLTDARDADGGLESGRYAAVVTIPKDFSARATSYSDQSGDTARRATLDVQTSQVTGIADPVVGQAITAAATRVLNNTLTESYLSNIYLGFNSTQKQFTKVAEAAEKLADGSKGLAKGVDQTGQGAAKLAEGADALSNGIGQTATGTKKLADGLGQLDAGGTNLNQGAQQLSKGTSEYAAGVHTLAKKTAGLPGGARKLANGAQQAADGADQLATGGAGLSRGLTTYQAKLRQQANQLAAAKAPVPPKPPSPPKPPGASQQAGPSPQAGGAAPGNGSSVTPSCPKTEPALTEAQCEIVLQTIRATAQQAAQQAARQAAQQAGQAAAAQFESSGAALAAYTKQLAVYSGKQGAAEALRGAADGLSQRDPKTKQSLLGGARQLASGQRQTATGLDGLANGTDALADGLKPLAAGIKKLDTGASALATGAKGLSQGVTTYTGGVHASATGAAQLSNGVTELDGGGRGLADGAAKLSSGVTKLSAGADKLADGTQQLADGLAKGADQIPTYDQQARQKLSTVAAAPVDTPAVHSAFSDVATTTLLATLALWIGALVSFLVLRPVSARVLSSMQPSWRLTLASLAPAAAIAAVQAVVLSGLLTVLLDLGAGQALRLTGLSLLAGLTFVSLNHALAAWFGGVGRFVSVVLVVLAVAGAITSAVPAVFDTVTPLLPLTPALQGMRAVVTGADGAGGHAGLLLAWLVLGLVAGVAAVARRRVVRAQFATG